MTLRITAELDGLEEVARDIELLERFFADAIKPMEFSSVPGNAVIQHELQFEEICSGMEENGLEVTGLTVFAFYARIAHFEKKNEKLKGDRHGNQQQ